jgi:xylulokinase
MLLLGIDIGTSSIKVSVVDAQSGKLCAAASYPDTEVPVLVKQPGWAEQSPDTWWLHTCEAIKRALQGAAFNPHDIGAIGIAYQMHGLVMVGEQQQLLRPSIIWCDSRAVPLGEKAFKAMGEEKTLKHLLNSPGNFTASKLAWVKENEPAVYAQTYKIMLPGDYIAMRMTGQISSSISSLSEGVFWDFRKDAVSSELMEYYGFSNDLLPDLHPVFSDHGHLQKAVADQLGLKSGIPITYKAGDQPNNALSLNVLEPGEVAATAGTSGVIYGVNDQATYDPLSRVNSFAHVNYSHAHRRIGVLLCINGTGILYRWVRDQFAPGMSYADMNTEAAAIAPGSDGLRILPFGNGAERMLENKSPGAHFQQLDLNRHGRAHIIRASQEGIACAFRYGLDIMRENGMKPAVIRAGRANMFLSKVFTEAFVNTTGVPVELYDCDGSVGAALGAGIGAGYYPTAQHAFKHHKPLAKVEVSKQEVYEEVYQEWKKGLEAILG